MARLRRREYPGAIYHVINRGNYRSDIFGSAGAAAAFLKALEEATERFGWKLGAYVVMRNHFHLAVQTPEPNLSAGMQWLQVTYAARFNRLRNETGHLFQGRYRAILLENAGVWARVADYIHLNPVRAGLVAVDELAQFRWTSIARFVKGTRFVGLEPEPWLKVLGFRDEARGWSAYCQHLRRRVAGDPSAGADEREELSRGWAVGTDDWRKELTSPPVDRSSIVDRGEQLEPQVVRRIRWRARLDELLSAAGRSDEDLKTSRKNADWKVRIADELQRSHGASVVWLAETLRMGTSGTARSYLYMHRNGKNSQNTT